MLRWTGAGLRNSIALATAVCLFTLPALFNGFPFVLDDTMDYVALKPVVYRSTFYSFFVSAADLGLSPWLPILVQAAIVAHLIWVWLRVLMGTASRLAFVAIVFALSAASSLPFVVSYLMPDIFTSIMILVTALVIFESEHLSRGEIAYLVVLLAASTAVHLSHIPILTALLGIVALVLLLRRAPLQMLAQPLALAIAVAALFASHVVLFGIARLSPAGPVFLVANLIGQGPAAAYLREACPAAGYKICNEVDSLPSDSNAFLWGGTLYRLGWFDGYREEASEIVSGTIRTRPLEVAAMAANSIARALVTHAPAADFRPLGWNTGMVEEAIRSAYGEGSVSQLRASAQVTDALPRELIKSFDDVILPLATLAVIGGAWISWRRGWNDLFNLTTTVLAGVLANILICAVCSGVFDRYQTRVTWLLPFLAIVHALRFARAAWVVPARQASAAECSSPQLRGI